MRLAKSLILMFAAVVAAVLMQEDDRDRLAEEALDYFDGSR